MFAAMKKYAGPILFFAALLSTLFLLPLCNALIFDHVTGRVTEEIRCATEGGKAACAAGVPESGNPFPAFNGRHYDWLSGWREVSWAKVEAEREAKGKRLNTRWDALRKKKGL